MRIQIRRVSAVALLGGALMSRAWNSPEREVTPESALRSRRRWLKGAVIGGLALSAGAGLWWWNDTGSDEDVLASGQFSMPGVELYPAATNARFSSVDRPFTTEVAAARYCN